jgi:competence protein ComEC
VVDPAFLLTCGATLAILVAAPLVDSKASGWLRAAAQIAAASAAAEIVLLPVGAAVFSRVTFAGLALNLLAIPLMAVAQIAGMLVVPAALVSRWLAAVAGGIAHVGAAGLIWSADLVQFAPMVTWRVAPPSPITCVVYYAGLGLAFIAWRRRSMRRRLAATVWLAAAAWILWPPASFFSARGDGRLHLTFLDVGQGDSIFVVFPQGSTLLVDAGGLGFSSAFDVGDRVVAPVIRAAGFRAIDRLALTHGDPDHIGGARAVLREFRPAEVWEGIPVPRSVGLTALRLETQALGARWANVFAGDAVRIDGVDVIARHPCPPEWERQKVRNDDSLVLELRWRDVSVLLTGDIGREAETALAASFREAPIRIVKVPHHGSRTSSTSRFVEALRPRLAVVSAGRANHFGHPVPEVLARYEAVGAEMFRTDRDGAVLVTTDGWSVSVESYNGNTKPLK